MPLAGHPSFAVILANVMHSEHGIQKDLNIAAQQSECSGVRCKKGLHPLGIFDLSNVITVLKLPQFARPTRQI
jgi:hypothetical protein